MEGCLASFLESYESDQLIPTHFQLYYEQAIPSGSFSSEGHIFDFSSSSTSLAFDDTTLGAAKEAWKLVMGSMTDDEEAEYMRYQDREGVGEDDGVND